MTEKSPSLRTRSQVLCYLKASSRATTTGTAMAWAEAAKSHQQRNEDEKRKGKVGSINGYIIYGKPQSYSHPVVLDPKLWTLEYVVNQMSQRRVQESEFKLLSSETTQLHTGHTSELLKQIAIHSLNVTTAISHHSQIADAPDLRYPNVSLVSTGWQCEAHTKDAYDDNLQDTPQHMADFCQMSCLSGTGNDGSTPIQFMAWEPYNLKALLPECYKKTLPNS